MNSDSDHAQEYTAVNESLNAVPEDISMRMAEISDKDAILHQFAKKCKIQNNEIKQRTATLNMYANSLLNIDSNIKKEKENFEQEIHQQFTELSENEAELNEEITLHETQHQENEKRIKLIETIKEQTLAKCKENAEQIQELTKRLEEFQTVKPKETEIKPKNDEIEIIKKQIEEEKIRVKPLDEKLEKQNQRLNKILQSNTTFFKKVDDNKKIREEIENKIHQSEGDQEKKIADIKRKIQKAKKNLQSLNQLQSDLETHSFSSRNRMTRIQNKINKIAEKASKYDEALSVMRKKDNEMTAAIKEIQDQKKQYREAYHQRVEFYKNIDISNKRAMNRTNEIMTELRTTKELQKKTDVEQFETETKIEKCKEQEENIQEEMEKIEQELDVTKQQENESLFQYNETQNELTEIENKEQEYEDTRKKLKDIHNSLKEKITKAHEDETELIQAFQRVKAGQYSGIDKQIKEIQKGINAFTEGYKSKIQFVLDANRLLQEKIKTEELKANFFNSEYNRNTKQLNSLSSSQIIPSPMKINNKTSKSTTINDELRTEITKLESTIKEKKVKITTIEKSISTKTKTQIEDLQETKYNEILNNKTDVSTKFIQQAENLLKEIDEANEKLQNGSSSEIIDYLNVWSTMLTKMISEAEDIEIAAELN